MKRHQTHAASLTLRPAFTALAAAIALAACETTPPVNTDLSAAHAAVEQAHANPAVVRSAAVELDRADQALRRADDAWAQNRDREQTRHLAYLATQRVAIAQSMAMQAQSDDRVKQASAERERLRLQARTQEADAALQDARRAQASARVAQGQAQASRDEAEAARAQADAARAQAQAAQQQASQQADRAASLERDLQILQARNTSRGMVVTLGDVLFDTGRATLQPGARSKVDQLAQVLRQYPERRIRIEGYTDNVGSEAMNLDLSRRRAEAFAGALIDAGITADRIDIRAGGEANPVADNATPAGRQLNRRVEVLFSDPSGRFASTS